MGDIIADLHLHSKYSRAVSPQMSLEVMAKVGEQKGIDLLSTGDWTHPLWLREIHSQLEESEEGIFVLKNRASNQTQPHPDPLLKGEEDHEVRFLLSVEISCIYSQEGKGRRIHNLVFVPSFQTAEKVNKELLKRGFNLSSDGRPIIGLSSKHLLELLLEIDERSLLIPAHIWTPWFGMYGQMSGFNSLKEAFEDMDPYIYGIETGLSSDPEMNWQVKELETRSILSFSDAHSPAKMGREATVFRLESLNYENIRQAIMRPSQKVHSSQFVVDGKETLTPNPLPQRGEGDHGETLNRVLYTVEFYPEEGKYHYSGHRNCKVSQTPEEQQEAHSICPVCKRPVTDGVMRRVQELSEENPRGLHKESDHNLVWITDPKSIHPPFVKIVPLNEIIAEAIGSPVASTKVKPIFDALCEKGGSEFTVLLKTPPSDIETIALSTTSPQNAKKIAQGIEKVQREAIFITPGYDGLYGVVKIWSDKEDKQTESKQKITQSPLDI